MIGRHTGNPPYLDLHYVSRYTSIHMFHVYFTGYLVVSQLSYIFFQVILSSTICSQIINIHKTFSFSTRPLKFSNYQIHLSYSKPRQSFNMLHCIHIFSRFFRPCRGRPTNVSYTLAHCIGSNLPKLHFTPINWIDHFF